MRSAHEIYRALVRHELAEQTDDGVFGRETEMSSRAVALRQGFWRVHSVVNHIQNCPKLFFPHPLSNRFADGDDSIRVAT
jgi:hypothetical protein